MIVQTLEAEQVELVVDDAGAGAVELALEELALMSDNPLSLDVDDVRALRRLPGISGRTIESIRVFIRVFGPPLNAVEFAAIEGVNQPSIERILPFIEFARPPPRREPTPGRATNAGQTRLRPVAMLTTSIRQPLETRSGYAVDDDSVGFLGALTSYRSSLLIRFGPRVTARLVGETDAGELVNWSPSAGGVMFDFLSAGIEVSGVGRLRRLIVGDFSVRVGYGLAMWSGQRRSGSTGSRIPSPRKTPLAAKTGTSESGFLRGVAATIGLTERIEVTSFLSRVRHDGRTAPGLHRTLGEIERRGQVTEAARGLIVSWTGRRLSMDVTAVGYRSTELDEREFASLGLGAGFNSAWYSVSAEAALHTWSPASFVIATSLEPAKWVQFGSMLRWYPATGHGRAAAPTGAATASGGTTPGMLNSIGLKYRSWRVRLFRDIFVGQANTSTRPRPEIRSVMGSEISFNKSRFRWSFSLLRDERDRQVVVAGSAGAVRSLDREVRMRTTLRVALDLTPSTEMRIVFSRLWPDDQPGSLLGQEIRLRPGRVVEVGAGLSVFSGVGPMYHYEPDVRLQYSVLRLSDAGSRAFIKATARPSSKLEFQIKYGQTMFPTEREIGSGLDRVMTDRLRHVTVSARLTVR